MKLLFKGRYKSYSMRIEIMGNHRKRQSKNFFKKIRNDFGQNVLSHMKNFSYTTVQLATKFNQRILLLHCRTEKILPQDLQSTATNSVSFDNDNVTRMNLPAKKRFLFSTHNLEIKDIRISIHRLKNDIRLRVQSGGLVLKTRFFMIDFESTTYRKYTVEISSRNSKYQGNYSTYSTALILSGESRFMVRLLKTPIPKQ